MALQLLPPPQWHHMKGGVLPSCWALPAATAAAPSRATRSELRRSFQSIAKPATREIHLDNGTIGVHPRALYPVLFRCPCFTCSTWLDPDLSLMQGKCLSSA